MMGEDQRRWHRRSYNILGLYLLLCVAAASICFMHCDGRKFVDLSEGISRRHSKSSNTKLPRHIMVIVPGLNLLDSSNTEQYYMMSSPFSSPPPPPPPYKTAPPGMAALWCVAKPTVPEPIIQEAMNYACASGADCDQIQPYGSCFQPDAVLAHASFAFNSYWQSTKLAGGTCDFAGSAMLVTLDPSYGGCHFIYS